MATPDRQAFEGHWVHSHEEDSEDEMIFRPASHPFPPSRGRASFDLRADGSYVERAPGPDDRPVERNGHWSLDGDRLVLAPDSGGVGRDWRVISIGAGRLAVQKGR